MIRLLVEVDGQESVLRTNRFVGGDAEGSTIESQRFTLDGRPLGEVDAARWNATGSGSESLRASLADRLTHREFA